MRVGRLALVVAVLLLPTTAHAHDHIADFFFAFCDAKASNLPGFQFSTAKTLPLKSLSFIGDVSIHDGNHEGVDLTRSTYLAGIRWTLGRAADTHRKVVPSVYVLAGGVHDNAGFQEGNEPAVALGGALDYIFKGDQGVSGLGARVQLDAIINSGDDFPRVSFGLVYWRH